MAKPGRPGTNWGRLFEEWLATDMPKRDFIKLQGLDLRSGTTFTRTRDWEERAQARREGRETINVTPIVAGGPTLKEIEAEIEELRRSPDPPERKDKKAYFRIAELVYENEQPEVASWQKIQTWRSLQASTDWRLADKIKVHLQLILDAGFRERDDGTYESKLSTTELRQLARSMSDVQRIQRLALGMSTENIGLDVGETHVEAPKADGEEAPKNMFVVELSLGGKFTRARPRRVS